MSKLMSDLVVIVGVAAGAAYTAHALWSSADADDLLEAWTGAAPPADGESEQRFSAQLAEFVFANPHAPAEAVFRFAAAQGIHAFPAEAWADRSLPFGHRAAYQIFGPVLIAMRDIIEDEKAAQSAAALLSDGPVLASALSLPVEETTLEMVPDPLETRAGYALAVIEPTPEPTPEPPPAELETVVAPTPEPPPAEAKAAPAPAKRKR